MSVQSTKLRKDNHVRKSSHGKFQSVEHLLIQQMKSEANNKGKEKNKPHKVMGAYDQPHMLELEKTRKIRTSLVRP